MKDINTVFARIVAKTNFKFNYSDFEKNIKSDLANVGLRLVERSEVKDTKASFGNLDVKQSVIASCFGFLDDDECVEIRLIEYSAFGRLDKIYRVVVRAC